MNYGAAHTIVKAEGRNLRHILESVAARIQADHSWSFVGAADTPATFEAVCAEFATAATRGGMVRVSDLNCATAVYGTVGNIMFRAIHDAHHYGLSLGFTSAEETLVNAAMYRRLFKAARVPALRAMTLPQLIYWIDSEGQNEFARATGGYVLDHTAFAASVLRAIYNDPKITLQQAVVIEVAEHNHWWGM